MWNYSEKVMDYFLHPKNAGEIKNPDGFGEVGSLACGDALRLTFRLGRDKRIKEAKFKTFGCASAIASSSALTEMIKGKTIEEAEKITNKDIANFLGGLPDAKMHCSVMGREALHKAIQNYRGDKKVGKKVLEGEVICNCFGVTDKEILEAIKANDLTTVKQVTAHTKAGGACGECHSKIAGLIKGAESESAKSKEKKLPKMTNLEKIGMIKRVVEETIRPLLKQDGGDIELLDVDGNTVYVKLKGACAHCTSAHRTMNLFVEKELQKQVLKKITVHEVK